MEDRGAESHAQPEGTTRRWSVWVSLASVWIFFTAIVNRQFIESGFDLVHGSMADPRFIMSILEHWYRALLGQQEFLRPLYFFPTKEHVLAYSDTFLLNSLFYIVPRFFVADEYLAFQGAQILFVLFGYLTFFYLARNVLGTSAVAACFGSVLFAFSAPMVRLIGAFQNSSTYLLPLVAILFARFLERAFRRERTQYFYLSALLTLLALIAFSTFYTVWFFILFAGPLGVIFLLLSPNRRELFRVLWRPAVFSAVVFPILLAPFFWLYGPLMGSRRDFSEALVHLYEPIDFVNANTPLWKYLLPIWRPIELNVYPPTIGFMILLFGTSLLYLLTRRRFPEKDVWRHTLILSMAAMLLLSIAFLLKVGDFSLWWLVYKLVPGAGAIRVVCRLFRFSRNRSDCRLAAP